MGTQQLLYVILVAVIVGIATFVALNTFDDARINNNVNEVQLEMLDAASRAHTYYDRPVGLGGGGKSFSNVTLYDIVLDSLNDNARYEITDRSASSFKIVAYPTYSNEVVTLNVTTEDFTWE